MIDNLITVKEDIKSAIINKQVTPHGGLITYADSIRAIDNNIMNISFYNISFGGSTFSSAPLINTADYTDMSSMFDSCISLVSIPQLDTSNVTKMRYMFYSCISLVSIPQLDTSNVTDMYRMFYGCRNLTELPLLDCSSLQTNADMFYNCGNLRVVGGFKNLGKTEQFQYLNLSYEPYLTKQSKLNIINNLYDRASAGYPNSTIYFFDNYIIPDEVMAIATKKGWTIKY